MKIVLPDILPEPIRAVHVPLSAQWLAGEGAGSWIFIGISKIYDAYELKRYSPEGQIECEGIFSTTQPFEHQKPYTVTYPTHCSAVTIIQNGLTITFHSLLKTPQ